jgi:AraC-like DNA-binding protein
MPLLIDTAVVPAWDRVEFWSESSRRVYHPLRIRSAVRGQFWGRMSGHELGPLGVYRVVAAPNTMIRTVNAIAAGDPECLHVLVVLRGELNAAQGGRTDLAGVGDVIGYETSHPVILRADKPFESLALRVSRHALGPHSSRVGSRTAMRISGSRASTRGAVACLRRLADALEIGAIDSDRVPSTVDCVLDVVRGLYAEPSGARASKERSRAEILLNIESFIEANLGDPDLDPEDIARACFISTRYLHKLFEAEGTSVCRWIREARLDRCRRDLADPALDHWTILAIASRWGLPGPQHFSRLFRAAYGCSPREFRRDARRDAPGPLSIASNGARRGLGLVRPSRPIAALVATV